MLSFFPRDVLDEILNLIESVSESFPTYSFKYRIFFFTDLFHGYIDMPGVLYQAGDAFYPRVPDYTSVLGSVFVYQIFRNCQSLNDLRFRTYDLDT